MSLEFFRLLVAFALALAVPLQGFTAATAGICMATGHHDAASHTHSGDAGAGHQHGHDAGQSQAGTAHCPPCVACCAAAVISSSVPIVIPDQRSDRSIAAAAPSFAGVQPDTLDRPPLVF
jgi:hypothetical protein